DLLPGEMLSDLDVGRWMFVGLAPRAPSESGVDERDLRQRPRRCVLRELVDLGETRPLKALSDVGEEEDGRQVGVIHLPRNALVLELLIDRRDPGRRERV